MSAYSEKDNNNNSDEADTDSSSSLEQQQYKYCTFAVTGPHSKKFQAIYVCRSCCSAPGGGDESSSSNDDNNNNLLCVCQACADSCHSECKGLEYIGMGPSYCDCNKIGKSTCQLTERSEREAKRLGVLFSENDDSTSSSSSSSATAAAVVVVEEARLIDGIEQTQVFRIPVLEESTTEVIVTKILQEQAKELVKHSRETFWVDTSQNRSDMCDLERLALRILEQHTDAFGLDRNLYGAEWWVQVKPVFSGEEEPASSSSSISSSRPSSQQPEEIPVSSSEYQTGSVDEAVDLHYDKDEALAESFGIGAFPLLSTVTYLTETKPASPPTVIFSRIYEQVQEESISQMFVSHPRRGKHLVFDGRLLHGAPSHPGLRRKSDKEGPSSPADPMRVTFLVNIWKKSKPAGVEPLPATIRDAILGKVDRLDDILLAELEKRDFAKDNLVERVAVSSEEDLAESFQSRIMLPFVGRGSTWGTADALFFGSTSVLMTFAPPAHDSSSVLLNFGEGLEAYITHLLDGEDKVSE